MIHVLLFILFARAYGESAVIRREGKSPQRRQNALAVDAAGRALADDDRLVLDPGGDIYSPWQPRLPGSPTQITVHITGNSGLQLTAYEGSATGQHVSFEDQYDECAQWRIIDDNEGKVGIQSVCDFRKFLVDKAGVVQQVIAIRPRYMPDLWTLKSTSDGGIMLASSRNKLLNELSSGAVTMVDNGPDAERTVGAPGIFKLQIIDISWGGASTTAINTYIVTPTGSMLKEGTRSNINLEGDVTDSGSRWSLSDAEGGMMFIKGANGDYLSDESGKLKMHGKRHLAAGIITDREWNMTNKKEGQVLVQSHRSMYLEEGSRGPQVSRGGIQIVGGTDIDSVANKLFTFQLHSVAWKQVATTTKPHVWS